MANTTIEWTDATWNPVAGCTVLTAGCTNCYAMRMAARLDAMGQAKYKGLTRRSGGRSVWTGKVRIDENSLAVPASWSKPRKVFVNSMSDLFHEAVPAGFIRRVWNLMAKTPRHRCDLLPGMMAWLRPPNTP
jgi:protein gp37